LLLLLLLALTLLTDLAQGAEQVSPLTIGTTFARIRIRPRGFGLLLLLLLEKGCYRQRLPTSCGCCSTANTLARRRAPATGGSSNHTDDILCSGTRRTSSCRHAGTDVKLGCVHHQRLQGLVVRRTTTTATQRPQSGQSRRTPIVIAEFKGGNWEARSCLQLIHEIDLCIATTTSGRRCHGGGKVGVIDFIKSH
jgi:hypothetical protein